MNISVTEISKDFEIKIQANMPDAAYTLTKFIIIATSTLLLKILKIERIVIEIF